MNHTPGPWTIQTIRDRHIWIRAGEIVVAEINGSDDPDDDRVEVDARLIAAAPDLLSVVSLAEVNCANALELLTKEFNSGPSGARAEAIAHIRKAILRLQGAMAKAEGRS